MKTRSSSKTRSASPHKQLSANPKPKRVTKKKASPSPAATRRVTRASSRQASLEAEATSTTSQDEQSGVETTATNSFSMDLDTIEEVPSSPAPVQPTTETTDEDSSRPSTSNFTESSAQAAQVEIQTVAIETTETDSHAAQEEVPSIANGIETSSQATQEENQNLHDHIEELMQLIEQKEEAFNAFKNDMNDLKKKYEDELADLKKSREDETTDLKKNHEEEVTGLKKNHENELRVLKSIHEDEVTDLKKTHEDEFAETKKAYEDDLTEMRTTEDDELTEIKRELRKLKDEYREIKADRQEVIQAIRTKNGKIECLRKRAIHLETVVLEEKERIEEEYDIQSEKNKSLVSELAAAQEYAAAAREDEAAKTQEIQDLRAELAQVKEANTALTQATTEAEAKAEAKAKELEAEKSKPLVETIRDANGNLRAKTKYDSIDLKARRERLMRGRDERERLKEDQKIAALHAKSGPEGVPGYKPHSVFDALGRLMRRNSKAEGAAASAKKSSQATTPQTPTTPTPTTQPSEHYEGEQAMDVEQEAHDIQQQPQAEQETQLHSHHEEARETESQTAPQPPAGKKRKRKRGEPMPYEWSHPNPSTIQLYWMHPEYESSEDEDEDEEQDKEPQTRNQPLKQPRLSYEQEHPRRDSPSTPLLRFADLYQPPLTAPQLRSQFNTSSTLQRSFRASANRLDLKPKSNFQNSIFSGNNAQAQDDQPPPEGRWFESTKQRRFKAFMQGMTELPDQPPCWFLSPQNYQELAERYPQCVEQQRRATQEDELLARQRMGLPVDDQEWYTDAAPSRFQTNASKEALDQEFKKFTWNHRYEVNIGAFKSGFPVWGRAEAIRIYQTNKYIQRLIVEGRQQGRYEPLRDHPLSRPAPHPAEEEYTFEKEEASLWREAGRLRQHEVTAVATAKEIAQNKARAQAEALHRSLAHSSEGSYATSPASSSFASPTPSQAASEPALPTPIQAQATPTQPELFSTTPSQLETARAKAEAFKPKTPSRLRETSRLPSSSPAPTEGETARPLSPLSFAAAQYGTLTDPSAPVADSDEDIDYEDIDVETLPTNNPEFEDRMADFEVACINASKRSKPAPTAKLSEATVREFENNPLLQLEPGAFYAQLDMKSKKMIRPEVRAQYGIEVDS